MIKTITTGAMCLFCSFLLVACEQQATPEPQTQQPVAPPKPATLFDRLGGNPGLSEFVGDLIVAIGADTRIKYYFNNVDINRFKTKLTEWLCQATGGPCSYNGRELTSVHRQMIISQNDFAAFMEDVSKTLDKRTVSSSDQAEVVKILEAIKSDILAAHGSSL
ncbi:MAG: group I truncated hemoglobin [Gammaproteobacteria bacterium]